MRKFESECWKCETTIRSNDSGATWRHMHKPEGDKHHAMPYGIMREI